MKEYMYRKSKWMNGLLKEKKWMNEWKKCSIKIILNHAELWSILQFVIID